MLAPSAFPRGYDMWIRLQFIGEIGGSHAERLRVIVRAVAGALGCAKRAREMVVGKRNIGAMLRVERDLEEISEIAVGASSQSAR